MMNGEITDNTPIETTQSQQSQQAQEPAQPMQDTQMQSPPVPPQGYAMNFDPYTGRPIRPQAYARNFDPYTGKPIVKPKAKYEMSKADYIAVIFSVLISIMGATLSLWGGFKIGFTITYLVLFIALSLYFFRKEHPLTLFGTLCGLLSAAASFVFAYSINGIVNFFLVIAMYAGSTVWFASLRGFIEQPGDFALFIHVITSSFGVSFPGLSKAWRSVFSGKSTGTKRFGKAMIGLACAIPLLIIVIALLSSADAAFQGLLEKIGEDLGIILFKILVGIVLAPFLFSFVLGLKKNDRVHNGVASIRGLDNVYSVSFLGGLILVYLVYLFSQLAYFINGFAGILPEGKITYAEYARRGFFELCFIAGLNLVLIFLALILTKKKKNKPLALLGSECIFISGFTLFLIATVFSKMVLYIQTFGLTRMRVLVCAFLIFLAVVFIAMIVRVFIAKTPVLRVALISALCVLLILGFGNVDQRIASYNLKAYQTGVLKKIDVNELYELDLNGVEALKTVYETCSGTEKDEALDSLHMLAESYFDIQLDRDEKDNFKQMTVERWNKELGSWNYSREKALNILKDYAVFYTKQGNKFGYYDVNGTFHTLRDTGFNYQPGY